MSFWRREDPLLKRADMLVHAANINAISMFTPNLDEHPCLGAVNSENWDFVLTVAGVFTAVVRIGSLRLEEAREQKLMDKISEHCIKWNAEKALPALNDCRSFVDKNIDALTAAGHEHGSVFFDALGLWIIWNVFGRAPQTDEERKLVHVVGSETAHTFYNWWHG